MESPEGNLLSNTCVGHSGRRKGLQQLWETTFRGTFGGAACPGTF
jgi:hypothetical protein